MKKSLTIAVTVFALGSTLTYVWARVRQPVVEPGVPAQVVSTVDSAGLPVRVVIDSFGNVLSALREPAYAGFAPPYQRGPRIIQVPQADAQPQAALQPDVEDDDEVEAPRQPLLRRISPPPREIEQIVPRRVAPEPKAAPARRIETITPKKETKSEPKPRRPFSRADAAPPVVERRNVISNLPPMDTRLTPIKPTPRYTAADKFTTTPPPGYTPPRNVMIDPKPVEAKLPEPAPEATSEVLPSEAPSADEAPPAQ